MPTPVAPSRISGAARLGLLHLRIAVGAGGLFTVLTSLYDVVVFGVADWPTRIDVFVGNIPGGVLFGLVMAVTGGIMRWRAAVAARDHEVAADPTASPAVTLRMTATRTVLLPLSPAEVLSRAAGSATALERARVRSIDETTGTTTLITSVSWMSWGERVVLATHPDDSGGTAVTITSKPLIRLTIFDYGRNRKNVERLAEWLRGLTA